MRLECKKYSCSHNMKYRGVRLCFVVPGYDIEPNMDKPLDAPRNCEYSYKKHGETGTERK